MAIFPTMEDFDRNLRDISSRVTGPSIDFSLPPDSPVRRAGEFLTGILAPFFSRSAARRAFGGPQTSGPLEEYRPNIEELFGPAPTLAASHGPGRPSTLPTPAAGPAVGGTPRPAAPGPATDPAELARQAATLFARMGFVPQTTGGNLAPSEMGMPSGRRPELLPAGFWNQHPGVSGGVLRVEEGPNAGKVYAMFDNVNKPKNVMEMVQPLIQEWSNRLMAAFQQGGPNQNMLALRSLADSGNPLYHLMTAGMMGEKLPSEISRNLSEASRPTVVPNVYSGRGGEVSTLLIPPGGSPRTIATGVHPTSSAGSHRPEDYIMKVMFDTEKAIAEAGRDPLLASDPAKLEAYSSQLFDRARNTINMIPKIFGTGGTPAAGITYDAYHRAAKARNPNASDDTILTNYQREVLGR